MAEKLVHPNYKLQIAAASGPFEMEFELWTETGLRETNWWLTFGGVEQDTDQFTPSQISEISRYVEDWRAPSA